MNQEKECRGKILVVDDDVDIRKLVSEILENSGYTVAKAEDGQEGLKIVKEGGIEAIVTDMNMPVMDGIQLAQKVNDYDPSIPVILHSGGTPEEHEKRYFFGILLKPVSGEDLLSVTMRAVESYRNSKEY